MKSQKNKLPCGDVGRIINSFISHTHPDAENWQRNYRQTMYDNRDTHKALKQINSQVFLIASNNFNRKYIHALLFPDWRRKLKSSYNKLNEKEKSVVNIGGLPKSWYPQKAIPKFIRIYRNTSFFSTVS
uniref:Uncharacterized protein n=1 Tax=viral metagenome TaxID=1070528 RepID=A0A6C0LX77_9ZZZZ